MIRKRQFTIILNNMHKKHKIIKKIFYYFITIHKIASYFVLFSN